MKGLGIALLLVGADAFAEGYTATMLPTNGVATYAAAMNESAETQLY